MALKVNQSIKYKYSIKKVPLIFRTIIFASYIVFEVSKQQFIYGVHAKSTLDI